MRGSSANVLFNNIIRRGRRPSDQKWLTALSRPPIVSPVVRLRLRRDPGVSGRFPGAAARRRRTAATRAGGRSRCRTEGRGRRPFSQVAIPTFSSPPPPLLRCRSFATRYATPHLRTRTFTVRRTDDNRHKAYAVRVKPRLPVDTYYPCVFSANLFGVAACASVGVGNERERRSDVVYLTDDASFAKFVFSLRARRRRLRGPWRSSTKYRVSRP